MLFLATGESKADAARRAFGEPAEPEHAGQPGALEARRDASPCSTGMQPPD